MKITTDNEKAIFDALVASNISFVDANAADPSAPVSFKLGDPASGLFVQVVDAPATNQATIFACGQPAVDFLAMLLRQRAEIEALRRQVQEAEVMQLAAQPHAYSPAALIQATA